MMHLGSMARDGAQCLVLAGAPNKADWRAWGGSLDPWRRQLSMQEVEAGDCHWCRSCCCRGWCQGKAAGAEPCCALLFLLAAPSLTLSLPEEVSMVPATEAAPPDTWVPVFRATTPQDHPPTTSSRITGWVVGNNTGWKSIALLLSACSTACWLEHGDSWHKCCYGVGAALLSSAPSPALPMLPKLVEGATGCAAGMLDWAHGAQCMEEPELPSFHGGWASQHPCKVLAAPQGALAS